MVTSRERMNLAQEGQAARNAAAAQAEGQIIAQQRIDDEIINQQTQQMRESREADMLNEVGQANRMQGQMEGQEQAYNQMNNEYMQLEQPGQSNGLNMRPDTIEGMQEQQMMQEQQQQQNMMIEEASMGADRAIQLLQEGAQPEVVDQMIDQNITDPQVNQMTKEILNQKIIDMSNQQQELNATSGSGQVQTGRPPSPVTAAANDILAQSMQTMQPQQPQQQQQQPMR